MPRTSPRFAARPRTALLAVASIAFPIGLVLPILRIERPFSDSEYGVLTGIWAMVTGGLPLLGIVVLCFSVAFPITKLALLWGTVLAPQHRTAKRIELLRRIGKWSMLDVYVVVILMGAVRLGVMAGVEARPGLFVFGGSVLLAMISTVLARRAQERSLQIGDETLASLRGPEARALSLAALGAYALGLTLPLMVVEKWVFWSNDYSILRSLAPLVEDGQIGLLALVLVFVILLPALRLLALAALRWRRSPSERFVRAVLALEEWAMGDVFALALLVVVTKAARLATVTARMGLWFLVVAAVLMLADASLLRRALRPRAASGHPGGTAG